MLVVESVLSSCLAAVVKLTHHNRNFLAHPEIPIGLRAEAFGNRSLSGWLIPKASGRRMTTPVSIRNTS
jgi:hypothetical protein